MGANTNQGRTPAATHTFALTHGQVAMALRIGGGDAATETAADRPMAVRTHRAGACVSAAMVVAAAMSLAHATENHESRGFASSARRGGGSIPRASGAPGHENTTSTSQEQSKMLSKITNVTAAAAVGMAATVAGAQSAVQWRTADGGNGHWYQGRIIDSAGVKWSRARDEAQRLGGDLVVLGSPQATAWVWEHVASQPSLWSAHFGPWVGARQPSGSMEPDGGWTWIDGTPVREFVPWAPGQPDDYTPCGGANDFMSYFKNFQSSPQNLMCDNADVAVTNCPGGTMGPTISAIVEWSRDCNHDGVVDYGQILGGELSDGNHNGIPDICEFLDCNRDGLSDLDQVAYGQLPDYDGNNIPDCCDRGEACVVGSYPVQWRTASGGNGHWYQAMSWSAPKTWPDALGGAQGLGGLLACVTSASENDWIAAHSDLHQPGCPGGSDGWHLGGYQDFTAADYSEPSGGWRWISGEPWSYTAWLIDVPGGDRPNNYGPGGEQYLKMSELPYAPRWDDVGTGNGNTMCGAIIEWSADCNNDGTVDYGQILRGELPDINHNGTPDTCECIGDIYVDRAINGADLGALLAYWGPTTSAAASRACDLNGDGVVNGSDLGVLLAYWGPCSN